MALMIRILYCFYSFQVPGGTCPPASQYGRPQAAGGCIVEDEEDRDKWGSRTRMADPK